MNGVAVADTFALRQALIRGVEYLGTSPAVNASAGDAATPAALVGAVLSEMAARGIANVPPPDGAGPDDAELPRDAAVPLDPETIAAILQEQQADGSWAVVPKALAPSSPEAGLDARLDATATCLRALAAALPRLSSDAALERAFWRDGYYVLRSFLAPADCDALARAHREIHGTLDVGFYTSWFQPPEARVFTDREVRAVMGARLKRLFPDHRMIFGTFMSKGCEGETAFPLHQDPTFIDERHWTPVTFWAPLVDVDERNGCIHAVRGSHLLSADPRLPYVAFPYADFAERLKACLEPIPMRAGDLLVFHPGLIHSSPPNVSGRLRIAAAGAMVPERAQTFFYRSREGDEEVTEVFAVDDAYYVGMAGDGAISDATRVGALRLSRPPSAVERLLADAEARSGRPAPRRQSEEAMPTAVTTVVSADADVGASSKSSAGSAVEDPPHVEVPPELRDALTVAVSSATGGAWALDELECGWGVLALNVGEATFDLRRAKPGTNSFKSVDGVAYSYRGRDLPTGGLARFQSLIEHLRPHARCIEDFLSTLEERSASAEVDRKTAAPARGETSEAATAATPLSPSPRRAAAPRSTAPRGEVPGRKYGSVRELPRLENLASVEFDADSIDLARAARVYADVGFIVVRGLLRPYMEPMRAEIRQAVELAYRELPEAKMERHGWLTPSGGVFSRVGERQLICAPLVLQTSPTMQTYTSDRMFRSLLDRLLAGEVHQIGSGQVMYKVADGGVETGLHQDSVYTKDFGFEDIIAAFTYVVPTTVERGCIWLVPYSHQLGILPHQDEGAHAGVVVPGTVDWEHALPIPGNPGDTLLWHFNVLHGSQPNVTADDRPAVVIRYGRRSDAEILAEHGLQDW